MRDDDTRLGRRVPGWVPPPMPGPPLLEGRFARLRRLEAGAHAAALFRANGEDAAMWDYMPYGPFADVAEYADWMRRDASGSDPFFYAIEDRASGAPGGVASFLRISPAAGSIEVGHIALSAGLRRTPAATEAMFLMMAWAFGAGYRRYEWKCNALNLASRRAAQRLGFSFEGVFRQAAVVKGRNRDTAWFAVTDSDWPALAAAFETWCGPENFDPDGRQRRALGELTAPVRVASDPALGA
ncbi:GNAT family N-acetyltransferase [Oceaniglobus roseus]|uniref:GNAT family N-acetyltransferase n=1 Tax=Oceaniglobus roseus TaxID=1737570 RepID=UPI000C7F2F7B|nr:GNAT family protein [Kandeliimicrobium roseum]